MQIEKIITMWNQGNPVDLIARETGHTKKFCLIIIAQANQLKPINEKPRLKAASYRALNTIGTML